MGLLVHLLVKYKILTVLWLFSLLVILMSMILLTCMLVVMQLAQFLKVIILPFISLLATLTRMIILHFPLYLVKLLNVVLTLRPGLANLRSLVPALPSCANPLSGQRWL